VFDNVPLEHEYHNLGNDCYRLGQYEKAIAHYTKAVQLNAHMVEAYFNRALAYARLGQYEAALADANRVLATNASLHDAYYLRGRIWELCLDDRAAVADYRKALDLNSSFEAAAEQLQLITSREGMYRELRELRDQIEVEPTNGYLRYQSGQRLAMIGHTDDALRALEQARADGFVMADLWVELGQVYVASGRTIQGIAAFRQAIRVDPTVVVAYAHLGQLLTEAGRFREAVGVFRQALAMPNDDMASLYCGLGTALSGLKRWHEAREAFRRALVLESRLGEAALGLATVAWRQGDYDAAGNWCQRAVEQSPDHLSANLLAVTIALSKGDRHAASEMILRMFQAHPDDARVAYVLWAVRTHVALRAGYSDTDAATVRFWESHEQVVESARRLVRDRVRTHRELVGVQRDLPEELLEACPLVEEAAELLYQRLVASQRTALEELYDEVAKPGTIALADRLQRAAEIARCHDEEWLSDLCSAYAAILSGTPEAPHTEVVLAALERLSVLRAAHADPLLEVYRLCLDGLAAESVEDMLDLAPRTSRLARLASRPGFIVPGIGSVLMALAAWLERVRAAVHAATASDEWTEIAERGLELRVHLAENVAPPEQWVISSMLTNFGMIARQHVPAV